MTKARVKDVMTTEVITAGSDTPYKEMVERMYSGSVSGLPVLDEDGRLVGIVTEADLLLAGEDEPRHRTLLLRWAANPKRLAALAKSAQDVRAADIMTKDVVTVHPDDTVREAASILLKAEVKRLPVVDEGGRVVGVVSRRDLLSPYLRPDEEIAREVSEEVIYRTMWIDPTTVRVRVDEGVVRLEGRVDHKSSKELMVELVGRVDGVVGVDDRLTFDFDDREVGAAPRPPLGWSENWVKRQD